MWNKSKEDTPSLLDNGLYEVDLVDQESIEEEMDVFERLNLRERLELLFFRNREVDLPEDCVVGEMVCLG